MHCYRCYRFYALATLLQCHNNFVTALSFMTNIVSIIISILFILKRFTYCYLLNLQLISYLLLCNTYY